MMMSAKQKKPPMGGSAVDGVSLTHEAGGVVLPSRNRADSNLRIATLSWNLAWGQEPVQTVEDFLAFLAAACQGCEECDVVLAAGKIVAACPSAESVVTASCGAPVVFEAVADEGTKSWFIAYQRENLPTVTMLRREQLVFTADQYAAFHDFGEVIAREGGVIRFESSGLTLVLFLCGENNVPQAVGAASILQHAPAHLQTDGSLSRILSGEWVLLNPAHRPYWPQIGLKGFLKVGIRTRKDGKAIGRTLERLVTGRRSFRDGTQGPVAVVHANNFHADREGTIPFASVVFGDRAERIRQISESRNGENGIGTLTWIASVYEIRERLLVSL
jgi:hypothetical protein